MNFQVARGSVRNDCFQRAVDLDLILEHKMPHIMRLRAADIPVEFQISHLIICGGQGVPHQTVRPDQ